MLAVKQTIISIVVDLSVRYKSAVWYHNDEQKKVAESRLQDSGCSMLQHTLAQHKWQE